MKNPEVYLIGDVLVDVTLKNRYSDYKLRLGGVVHAARGLWAIDIPYSVGYFSPDYLDATIQDYLLKHGCQNLIKLGNVIGSPYVFLIEEAREVHDQGYEFLLRDNLKLTYNDDSMVSLADCDASDVLFISGNYSMQSVLPHIPRSSRIHIDLANNFDDLRSLQKLPRKFATIFLSTSSNIFRNLYNGKFYEFVNEFSEYADSIILKENRGGSRGYRFKSREIFASPSQTQPIQHSIGVGDVFNSIYISSISRLSMEKSMVLSSWIAAEYAINTDPDDFKSGAQRVIDTPIDDLISLGGVCIPWELRTRINIYIAAPDFDYMNTEPIEILEDCLKYNNFRVRRPVKEIGQMEEDATIRRKNELYRKDMQLLAECQILIAVLLSNDPGTFIEIGIAVQRGMPVLLYDPFRLATNCLLTQIPQVVTNDLDLIITEVFVQSNKIINNE